jgi:hypothetical protein
MFESFQADGEMLEASGNGNHQRDFNPPSVFDLMGIAGSSRQQDDPGASSTTARCARNPVSTH